MTEKIRWGILGAGFISDLFVTDLLATDHSVSAVGARSLERGQSFAAKHGIARVHDSYEALVADEHVDIVYVATPHNFHHEHALLALNAGKHVLVEKAFAQNAAQAEEMVAVAAAKNLVILEAMWTRWLPHMVRLREIIAAGTIGEVRTVIADHNQKLSADPLHRINNPELAGGALLDLGIYPISFAWDVLGAPSSIQSLATMTATGVDRQTSVIFGYESGAQAILQTALDTAGPITASVIGMDGWIAIESEFYAPTAFAVFDSAGAVVERFTETVVSRGMQYQAAEAERLIAAGLISGTILPPAESVAIMETLDHIREQIGLQFPHEQ
jgi:predicted dehydrogenase